jgi:predicted RNA polymerase sigma factor
VAQRHLKKVASRARQVGKAREALGDAMLAALESGESGYDIAPYAKLSSSQVYNLIAEARERRKTERPTG